MRGKSSSRVRATEVMESPSSKPKEEAHLSGAYIRSLVKHLSSSRSKERTTNPISPDSTLESPPPPPHHPKKQVRRRLHTSRPYQERLLNMAEARREIVTALKFHRASRKQANEQHQHQPPPNPNPNSCICEAKVPNLLIAKDATCLESRPPLATPWHYNMWQSSTSWSYPTLTPLPDIRDDPNLSLPNQTLGLNLNFHDFNNIDTTLCNSSNNKEPPIQLLSPPHSSSSSHSYSDIKLHVAVDEKQMEEIRSIGEKHDIEWNDTMNLMTSAWWSKFMEMEAEPVEASDISAWLEDGSDGEANASHLVMKNRDECMDIEENDWLDGECLS